MIYEFHLAATGTLGSLGGRPVLRAKTEAMERRFSRRLRAAFPHPVNRHRAAVRVASAPRTSENLSARSVTSLASATAQARFDVVESKLHGFIGPKLDRDFSDPVRQVTCSVNSRSGVASLIRTNLM